GFRHGERTATREAEHAQCHHALRANRQAGGIEPCLPKCQHRQRVLSIHCPSCGRPLAGKMICVCVTMAASLPSPRVMLVCKTIVVRPECSGVHTARAVSPLRMGAKKLVLLSMVAVRWSGVSAALAVIPPMVSPQPINAPPWMTPRRLH